MDRKMLVIGAALVLILAAQAGAWEFVRTEPIPSGTAVRSANGQFAARMTWGKDPMLPEIGSFTLTGPDGSVLWSKTAFGENSCFIANDGKTVVGMRGPGVERLPATLSFYGPKGKKQAEVLIKGLSGTGFSPDGSTFFVRSQDLGIGAFDRSGKKLWQVAGGRLFTPGPVGRRLAVEDQGTLYL